MTMDDNFQINLNVTSTPVRKKRGKEKPPEPTNDAHTSVPIFPEKRFEKKASTSIWKQLKTKPTNTSNKGSHKGKVSSGIEFESSQDDSGHGIQKTKGKLRSFGNSTQVKMTSLFRNNPEIPAVAHRAVKPVKEAVFSEISFTDLSLHPYLVKNLRDSMSLIKATAVQEKGIPVLMAGQDALIRSQTGSGKTLAFVLPILDALQKVRPKISRAEGVRVLVVVPTRELALQTYEVFDKLVKTFTWIVAGYLVGGEKRKSEKARLRKGVSILVGTPGRLIDHIQHTRALQLSKVEWLVLDEADRMLDLGYEKDVATLINALDANGQQRQTVLMSATLTSGVERLAGITLRNHVLVDTADDPREVVASKAVPVFGEADGEEANVAVLPESLVQQYLVTPAKLRLVSLAAFILWKCKLTQFRKMLVFVATQDMVDYHTELLSAALSLRDGGGSDEEEEEQGKQKFNNAGIELFRLHGSMDQKERTDVFKTFRKAESGVLICTDVASRGLDLPHVDWVLQYTGPTSISDYVHRVGRTARGGQQGSAAIFLTPSEVGLISKLEAQRIRLQEVSMETCLQRLMSLDSAARSMEEAATNLQVVLEQVILAQPKMYDLGCKGFSSWVRFYSSYPRIMKSVFNVKAVHLGHFAKSFALRVAPSQALRDAKRKASKDDPRFQKKRERHARIPAAGRPRNLNSTRKAVSEFDSGLEPLKKRRKAAA